MLVLHRDRRSDRNSKQHLCFPWQGSCRSSSRPSQPQVGVGVRRNRRECHESAGHVCLKSAAVCSSLKPTVRGDIYAAVRSPFSSLSFVGKSSPPSAAAKSSSRSAAWSSEINTAVCSSTRHTAVCGSPQPAGRCWLKPAGLLSLAQKVSLFLRTAPKGSWYP